MNFSAKAEYGVRLMIELGRQQSERAVSLKAISEAEKLPLAYLEHVAADLKAAGLVESSRGAHGGYRLARPASAIDMAEVVQALEGPIAPMDCFGGDAATRGVLTRARPRARLRDEAPLDARPGRGTEGTSEDDARRARPIFRKGGKPSWLIWRSRTCA